jgi:hypothetical protein
MQKDEKMFLIVHINKIFSNEACIRNCMDLHLIG